MRFKQRLKALFRRPKGKLFEVMPELQQLRQELQSLSETENPLTEIVHFFDSVSRWHDRGADDIIMAFEEVNYGQHDGILEKLRTLQKHFGRAGRCKYGWNRTERGERVTMDKVFLGNVYGLFTRPVSFWIQRKSEKKGGWGYSDMEHLNAYDVVSRQAAEFMDSHIEPIIKIINTLEAAC